MLGRDPRRYRDDTGGGSATQSSTRHDDANRGVPPLRSLQSLYKGEVCWGDSKQTTQTRGVGGYGGDRSEGAAYSDRNSRVQTRREGSNTSREASNREVSRESSNRGRNPSGAFDTRLDLRTERVKFRELYPSAVASPRRVGIVTSRGPDRGGDGGASAGAGASASGLGLGGGNGAATYRDSSGYERSLRRPFPNSSGYAPREVEGRSSKRDSRDGDDLDTSTGSQKRARHGEGASGAGVMDRLRDMDRLGDRGDTTGRFGSKREEPVSNRAAVPRPPPVEDDADGHYVFQPGHILDRRYRTVKLLGEGTFGKVVECSATDRNGNPQKFAIKVVKNRDKYRDAAKFEIEILKKISNVDIDRNHCCIHMLRSFDWKNHICLVFKKRGLSVYDYLRLNSHMPFPLHALRETMSQLLIAVKFMHRLSIIHTDLKPENILYKTADKATEPGKKWSLAMPAYYDLELIDFGSAAYADGYHAVLVSTRHYRAPEVVLGLGWSWPCDMWSVGCILAELYCGEALFQTHDNAEHLAMMERLLGPIPTAMTLTPGRHSSPETHRELFRSTGALRNPEGTSSKSARAINRMASLDKLHANTRIGQECYDLTRRMLQYDPANRISAAAALDHPFFTMSLAENDILVASRDPNAWPPTPPHGTHNRRVVTAGGGGGGNA